MSLKTINVYCAVSETPMIINESDFDPQLHVKPEEGEAEKGSKTQKDKAPKGKAKSQEGDQKPE